MALTDTIQFNSSCSGNVEEFGAMADVVNAIEAFLRTSLAEITPTMRNLQTKKPKRRNEKDLCAELGKKLNFAAHDQLFSFYPEDPEDESASRTLDFVSHPTRFMSAGTRIFGATDRLYGIEAKRLPTHDDGSDKEEREREYVVGDWKNRSSDKKRISGGIERFKKGLHGADFEASTMIAFVQQHSFAYWFNHVNSWIQELVNHPLPAHDSSWQIQDQLEVVVKTSTIQESASCHDRYGATPIRLRHFWLNLN